VCVFLSTIVSAIATVVDVTGQRESHTVDYCDIANIVVAPFGAGSAGLMMWRDDK
jgi:hypothetical protein